MRKQLETDKRFLFELQSKQASEIESLRKDQLTFESISRETIRDLEASKHRLEEEAIEFGENRTSEMHEITKERDSLLSQTSSQHRAIESFQRDLTMKNSIIEDKSGQILALEERCNGVSEKLQGQNDNGDELRVIKKELSDMLQLTRSLEATNQQQTGQIRRLQTVNGELALVAEENKALSKKLTLMDDLRSKLAETEISLVALAEEKTRWSVFLKQGEDITEASRSIALERLHHQSMSEKCSLVEAQLAETHVKLSNLRDEISQQQQNLEQLNLQLTCEKRVRLRTDRTKQLAQQEVQFLRNQLVIIGVLPCIMSNF